MAFNRKAMDAFVDEELDEAKRYFVIPADAVPLFSREQVKRAVGCLITGGITGVDSWDAPHAFRGLMEAVGVKAWSTDEAEASVIGSLRARRELTPEVPPNEDLVVALKNAEALAKAAADVSALHSNRGTEEELHEQQSVPAEVLVALRALRSAIYDFRRVAYFIPGNPAGMGDVLTPVEIEAVREQKVRMLEEIRALRDAKGAKRDINPKRKALLEQRERDEAVNEALEEVALQIADPGDEPVAGSATVVAAWNAKLEAADLIRAHKRQIG